MTAPRERSDFGQQTQTTTYGGETILVGRYAIRVSNGVLSVTDMLGEMPMFHRPAGQRTTIAVQVKPGGSAAQPP